MNILDKEMNSLDKKIMLATLSPQSSMYELEHNLITSNYPTVRRHIKKMQKDGLLNTTKVLRKDGKLDKRNTTSPTLTLKGLATLIIDGDLQKDELKKSFSNYLQKTKFNLAQFLSGILSGINIEEIYADTCLKMKPKINLKFFNETYFNEVLMISIFESMIPNKISISKTKAQELQKQIPIQAIESAKDIQKIFIQKRDKYNKYVQLMDEGLSKI